MILDDDIFGTVVEFCGVDQDESKLVVTIDKH